VLYDFDAEDVRVSGYVLGESDGGVHGVAVGGRAGVDGRARLMTSAPASRARKSRRGRNFWRRDLLHCSRAIVR
jgi:hypothetical protein